MYLVLTDRDEELSRLKLTLGKDLKQVKDSKELWNFLSHDVDENCLLVVIGSAVDSVDCISIAEELRISNPTIGIILLRSKIDTQFTAQALKSGIREVVSGSDPESIVLACKKSEEISRRQKRSFSSGNRATRTGKVLLLLSAKDGAGVTTVVANLAALFAQESETKVCIIESTRSMGDLGVRFQTASNKSWIDLVGIQELDDEALESVIAPTKYGFDLLLSPRSISIDPLISIAEFKSLILFLKQRYDLVLIDSGAEHDIWGRKLLTLADLSIVVSDTDLASLKNAKLLITELMNEGISQESTLLILNRCEVKSGVNPDDVSDLINFEVDGHLPWDLDVVRLSNSFEILTLIKPRAKYSQELMAFSKIVRAQLDNSIKSSAKPKLRVRKSA
jgi:pilus assembly protein CpaE